eukprot:614917-Amphidinium_carterae.1
MRGKAASADTQPPEQPTRYTRGSLWYVDAYTPPALWRMSCHLHREYWNRHQMSKLLARSRQPNPPLQQWEARQDSQVH